MSKIIKEKLILNKIVIAVIFGIVGFFVNFNAVDFIQFTDFKVNILSLL